MTLKAPEKKSSEEEGLSLFQKKDDIKNYEELKNQSKPQGGLFGVADNLNDAALQGGFFGKTIQGAGLFSNLIEKKNEKEISVSEIKPNLQNNKLSETSADTQNQHFGIKGNGKTDEANALQSAPFFTTTNSQSIKFQASSSQNQPQPQSQPQLQPQPQPQSQPQPKPQIQPIIQTQAPLSLFSQQTTDNKTNVPVNLFGNNNIQNNNNQNFPSLVTPSFPAFAQPQPGSQPQGLSFGNFNNNFILENF